MANLAFRSFTTFGYFGAALLIVVVAVLALTSFGDDTSGQQALDTATPTPTRVSISPAGDVNSIGDGIEAADAGDLLDARAGVCHGLVRITQTGGAAGQEAAGNETPDCPLTLD